MKIKKSTVIYAILLILFFVGLSVRVNMMGMPETHPGNLKAGNAFYHTIAADAVANGDDPFTYPSSLAMGHDNVLNIVSQHQSLVSQLCQCHLQAGPQCRIFERSLRLPPQEFSSHPHAV